MKNETLKRKGAAVVETDKTALSEYRAKKKANKEYQKLKEDFDILKEEVNKSKEDLSEIKSLLKELINQTRS